MIDTDLDYGILFINYQLDALTIIYS